MPITSNRFQFQLSRLYLFPCLICGLIILAFRTIPLKQCGTLILCGLGLLEFGALLGVATFAVAGLVGLVLKANARVAIPLLLISTSAIALFFWGPHWRVLQSKQFETQIGQYEQAALLVKNGAIKGEDDYSLRDYGYLPAPYQHLSCNSKVMFSTDGNATRVLFYTLIDFDSFAGYLYTSDGNLPNEYFFFLTTPEKSCVPVRPNWYYCEYSG